MECRQYLPLQVLHMSVDDMRNLHVLRCCKCAGQFHVLLSEIHDGLEIFMHAWLARPTQLPGKLPPVLVIPGGHGETDSALTSWIARKCGVVALGGPTDSRRSPIWRMRNRDRGLGSREQGRQPRGGTGRAARPLKSANNSGGGTRTLNLSVNSRAHLPVELPRTV